MNTSPPLERPASWSPPASCAPVLADDYSGKAPAPLLNHLSDVHWGPLNDRREDQVAPGLKVLQFIHLERNLNNALDTQYLRRFGREIAKYGVPGHTCQALDASLRNFLGGGQSWRRNLKICRTSVDKEEGQSIPRQGTVTAKSGG